MFILALALSNNVFQVELPTGQRIQAQKKLSKHVRRVQLQYCLSRLCSTHFLSYFPIRHFPPPLPAGNPLAEIQNTKDAASHRKRHEPPAAATPNPLRCKFAIYSTYFDHRFGTNIWVRSYPLNWCYNLIQSSIDLTVQRISGVQSIESGVYWIKSSVQ